MSREIKFMGAVDSWLGGGMIERFLSFERQTDWMDRFDVGNIKRLSYFEVFAASS